MVTGGTGFVGPHLVTALMAAGHQVRLAVRSTADTARSNVDVERVAVGAIGRETDWTGALDGIDAVVHAAARAHVMTETAPDPDALYRSVNLEGTRSLATAAAGAGVERIVFLSTVKVLGETSPGRRFAATDPPRPADPYARSKWLAEQALAEVAAQGGPAVTVLRPPLVHGPGVKGNLWRLLALCSRPIPVPLPLGAVDNRRSLIGAVNLAHATALAVTAPGLEGGTFLIRDGEDISTPDLVRRLAGLLGRPTLLVPVPTGLMRRTAAMAGKEAAWSRLAGDLTVDDSPFRDTTGWRPPLTLDQGLDDMVQRYCEAR